MRQNAQTYHLPKKAKTEHKTLKHNKKRAFLFARWHNLIGGARKACKRLAFNMPKNAVLNSKQ